MKEGWGYKERGFIILNKQIKKGLFEKMKSEQIPKRIERVSHKEIQVEDTIKYNIPELDKSRLSQVSGSEK